MVTSSILQETFSLDSGKGIGLDTTLARLCQQYSSGMLPKRHFVLACRGAGNPNSLDFFLLLKRVEKTVGFHICEFWNECMNNGCRYDKGGYSWETESSSWLSLLDVSSRKRQSGGSPRRGRLVFSKTAKEQLTRRISCASVEMPVEETASNDVDVEELPSSEPLLDLLGGWSSDSKNAETSSTSSEESLQNEVFSRMSLDTNRVPSASLAPKFHAEEAVFDSIPVIDIGGLFSEDLSDRSVCAKEIAHACHNVGFLYITNHGIDQAVVHNMQSVVRRFFASKRDYKDQFSMRKAGSIRGYFAVLEEDLNGEGFDQFKDYKGDMKEGFDIGYEPSLGDVNDVLTRPNTWPSEEDVPGFRAAVDAYMNALLNVATHLLRGFALSLNLPENFFTDKCRTPMATLRNLHYPPQTSNFDKSLGCGAHTDYGCFTILWQDEVGGLQIRNQDGNYINAPYIEGSFVVNIGDMMQRWTQGLYKSTVHRVINTTGRERYSMPFFYNPDVDAVIEPLPTVCQDGSFEPATCREILLGRYAPTFAHVKK